MNLPANGRPLPARTNATVTLAQARALTPAPAGVGAWAESLRQAVFATVTEADVGELMKAQVDKAKAGDTAAAKFVLGYLTGGGAPKVTVEKVVVRQVRPKRRAATGGPEPEAADAPPPVPVAIAPPGSHAYRRLALRFLQAEGPSPATAVAAELGVLPAAVGQLLAGDPRFVARDGAWAVTPLGRQQAG